MKKILVLCAMLVTAYSYAQQEVLFSIDNDKISTEEFKAVYLKNRDIGKDIDPKTPREYLDLFINFKLKVKEARDMGLDTLPNFKREFANYRKQLAQPYLEDRSVDSMLLAEAYNRLKIEVNASHIMIDLAPNALPEDTIVAYKQIMNIRAQILKGAVTFDVQARKFSTDPGSSQNGGNLGYFTVFDMVYPFENAAYSTPIGEISMPVRTQFGYHIVKVLDKRPSSGSVQVKHIFLISNDKTESEKAIAAAARIQEIYARLQASEDFDQLARQFSDDKNTSEVGGLLKPFGINTMMPEFEEQSFALKNMGDYSKPFKTSIGWHIVKLVKREPMQTFAEAKGALDQQISRDSRSAKSREVFTANLKKEYNFKEQPKQLKEVFKVMNEGYLDGMWDPKSAAKLKKTLFTLDGKEYNQQDFVVYLNNAQKRGNKGTNVEQEVYAQYKNYVDATIMSYEDSRLESKYLDFKLLVNEYHDGILLFDLTQDKVWNKASRDTVGLDEFYAANKSKYMWPDRVRANLYSCDGEKTAKKVEKLAKKGEVPSVIEAKFNKESQLVVVAESGKFSKGQNRAVDQSTLGLGNVSMVFLDSRFIVVQIAEVLPSQVKKLDECRGIVISDYQKQLESNWIAELKAKYTVTVNEATFKVLEEEIN